MGDTVQADVTPGEQGFESLDKIFNADNLYRQEGGEAAPDKPAAGEPPAAETEPAPAIAESEIEIEGLGKLKTSELKARLDEHRALKARADQYGDLDEALEGLNQAREQVRNWEKLAAVAQKNPELLDRITEVLKQYTDNPELLGEPLEKPEGRDDPANEDLEWVHNKRVDEARTEIRGMVTEAAQNFPGIVQANDGWIETVLGPAVQAMFGDRPTPSQIEVALHHLIVKGGGLKAAENRGAQEVADQLSKKPKGTVVVPGSTTRTQAREPEKDWSKASEDEILSSIAKESFTRRR